MNSKDKTMESYDKHAIYFANNFNLMFENYKRTEFSRFIQLVNGKRILDLGCGGGQHALYFKQNGLDVRCIDLSKGMVEICKGKGLNAEIMDIEDLNFKDNSFDGIWAATSLLHVPKNKLKGVLTKICSMLSSEGILFVSVKAGHGEHMLKDKNDSTTERFFSFWGKEELIAFFEPLFELIEYDSVNVEGTTFLKFFFRKKQSSEPAQTTGARFVNKTFL